MSVNNKKKKLKIKKKVLVIGSIILLSVLLVIALFYFLVMPKLSLKGDKNIDIEYGDTYSEPGYSASYLGDNLTDKVWIEGEVDNSKVGTYVLKYNVQKNKIKVTKKRNVNIVDTVKPSITLVGEEVQNVCPGIKYEEEGYSSEDNYDGDLTEKVKVETSDEEIKYIVKDSSGNTTTKIRKTNRIDADGPVITLKGSENYYVFLNSTFNDPGYTAIDNCDGDLTNKVKVTGTVDTKTVGKYDVVYSVSDTKGNVTKVTRVVTVSKEIKTEPAVKGAIYLTFDDGPSATITAKLLDILKQKGVKATFFVINHEDSLDYLIKREYDEGHTVAIHSYSHDYATIYKSSTAFFNDLELMNKKIKRLTGEESHILRFPGGSSNTVSRHYSTGIMSTLVKEVQARGYHYFDWNVSSGDAGDVKDAQGVYKNVINGLSKNKANIILMHDFESNYKTLNAISDIIDYGLKNGYEFKTIDMTTEMVKHGVNN